MIRLPNTPTERPSPTKHQAQEDLRQLTQWREQLYRILSMGGSTTYAAGAIGAGGFVTFTVPVVGARTGNEQACLVGPPSAINAGLLWDAVVTATDVATIRVYNTTGGPITPASSVWSVRVLP